MSSLLSYAPEYRMTAAQALKHPWLVAATPKAVSASSSGANAGLGEEPDGGS